MQEINEKFLLKLKKNGDDLPKLDYKKIDYSIFLTFHDFLMKKRKDKWYEPAKWTKED